MGLGFPNPLGEVDQGGIGFWTRFVIVREIRGKKGPWDVEFLSPGAAVSRRCPEGQLVWRAGSMTPGLSTITQWGSGFHTRRSGVDSVDLR